MAEKLPEGFFDNPKEDAKVHSSLMYQMIKKKSAFRKYGKSLVALKGGVSDLVIYKQ